MSKALAHHGRLEARVDGQFRIEVSETPGTEVGSDADWLRHVYVYLGDSSISLVVEGFEVAEIAASLRSAAADLETWAATRPTDILAQEQLI